MGRHRGIGVIRSSGPTSPSRVCAIHVACTNLRQAEPSRKPWRDAHPMESVLDVCGAAVEG
eukprot:4434-Pyramimonas_sp.AAC.1